MNQSYPKVQSGNRPVQTMDGQSTYEVEGRTFIVQSVFQEKGQSTLASLLMDLMRAEAFSE